MLKGEWKIHDQAELGTDDRLALIADDQGAFLTMRWSRGCAMVPKLICDAMNRLLKGDAPAIGERAAHYGAGRQPIDDIVDTGWGPAFAAGNVLKYIRRAAAKNGEDDVRKARWYYDRLNKMCVEPPAGAEFHTLIFRDYCAKCRKNLDAMLTNDERSLLHDGLTT